MTIVGRALNLATQAHNGTSRKYGSNEPYVNHVIRVAFDVSRYNNTQTPHDIMVSAALLHDVLEDTDTPPENIKQTAGPDVLRIVQELTNPSHLPENKNKPRAERKRIDREHLKVASREAKLIKLADRLDNLRDVHQGPKDFQTKYAQESQLLLDVLKNTHPDLETQLQTAINNLLQ